MNCIDGHGEMLVRHVFDVQIDHCHDCGGTWLDPGEIARSLHAPPAYEEGVDKRIVMGVADMGRSCPRCVAPLMRAHLDGLPMHRCRQCRGTWLDSDSMERLKERSPQGIYRGAGPAANIHGTAVRSGSSALDGSGMVRGSAIGGAARRVDSVAGTVSGVAEVGWIAATAIELMAAVVGGVLDS